MGKISNQFLCSQLEKLQFSGVELSAITIGINSFELVSVKATTLVVYSKTYQRLRSAVLPYLLSLRAISLPVREIKKVFKQF